jgi:hypothetical protein
MPSGECKKIKSFGMNEKYHLLVYANDTDLLGDSINTIKENTDTLSGASWSRNKAEKTKYIIISRHQNSVQNQNIRTANGSFEKVAKSRYLRKTLTDRSDIPDEIKSKLNLGNACHHTVQNLLSSPLI